MDTPCAQAIADLRQGSDARRRLKFLATGILVSLRTADANKVLIVPHTDAAGIDHNFKPMCAVRNSS